jgi:hypothetical protein
VAFPYWISIPLEGAIPLLWVVTFTVKEQHIFATAVDGKPLSVVVVGAGVTVITSAGEVLVL